ncbi:hypothetical protein RNJ44_02293 [Nakaseomyces bracarensis]|uniref:Uncharacterized protein n=1 Tax=Nakaseomyces bracarensis TaxID=273131 RepID=A0ABR4NN22_9SACH
MVDDTYYITPHEAALALVATAMKKARLTLDALALNCILGGVVFSAGPLMFLAVHSESPELWDQNPGVLVVLGSMVISIGLFYVVILGADLFNSNVLFFSVAFFRGAVSIWDVLLSWFFSWIGNIAGSLFVCYVIVFLSGIGRSPEWKASSIALSEQKAKAAFMETFLKSIGGNFFVAMAIYLQLLSKPFHVKFLAILMSIFTLACIGFTHVVADETILFIGMLNGADVSVGKYIWKLLIPASVGNMIGGVAFGLYIPFYLHLTVVERDQKKLLLPEYEERDEQPELNVDSRVVRVPREEAEEDDDDDEDSSDRENYLSEKLGQGDSSETTDTDVHPYLEPVRTTASRPVSDISLNTSDGSIPLSTISDNRFRSTSHPNMSVNRTMSSSHALRYTKTSPVLRRRKNVMRSPPGVFPVRGMGQPLTKERTIQNPYYTERNKDKIMRSATRISDQITRDELRQDNSDEHDHENYLRLVKTIEAEEAKKYKHSGGYNVLENKPGARLEKVVTGFVRRSRSRASNDIEADGIDPRKNGGSQDLFPHNSISAAKNYGQEEARSVSHNIESMFKNMPKAFERSERPTNSSDIEKELSKAGISRKAANAANTVAGMENYSDLED